MAYTSSNIEAAMLDLAKRVQRIWDVPKQAGTTAELSYIAHADGWGVWQLQVVAIPPQGERLTAIDTFTGDVDREDFPLLLDGIGQKLVKAIAEAAIEQALAVPEGTPA